MKTKRQDYKDNIDKLKDLHGRLKTANENLVVSSDSFLDEMHEIRLMQIRQSELKSKVNNYEKGRPSNGTTHVPNATFAHQHYN